VGKPLDRPQPTQMTKDETKRDIDYTVYYLPTIDSID
jgi:hypothetical protein